MLLKLLHNTQIVLLSVGVSEDGFLWHYFPSSLNPPVENWVSGGLLSISCWS
jgi:hypothetical protein